MVMLLMTNNLFTYAILQPQKHLRASYFLAQENQMINRAYYLYECLMIRYLEVSIETLYLFIASVFDFFFVNYQYNQYRIKQQNKINNNNNNR